MYVSIRDLAGNSNTRIIISEIYKIFDIFHILLPILNIAWFRFANNNSYFIFKIINSAL